MANTSVTEPLALALNGVIVSLLNKFEEKGIFTVSEIRDLLDML